MTGSILLEKLDQQVRYYSENNARSAIKKRSESHGHAVPRSITVRMERREVKPVEIKEKELDHREKRQFQRHEIDAGQLSR